MDATVVDYVVVAALGLLVGAGELVSRYRDAPAGALRSGAAIFYMALNVTASIIALALTHIFDWKFGVTAGGPALRWTQVGVAGTGAMALFRTSLFTVHTGDRDIGVGPGSFLQIFRDAVGRLMEGISYDQASRRPPSADVALIIRTGL